MIDKLGDFYKPVKNDVGKSIKDIEKSGMGIPVLPAAKENIFKKFYKFLKKDSWASLIVSLVLAFVIIKFIFFPALSFLTGSALPLVIVESCSMYHSDGLEDVLRNDIYEEYNIDFEDSDDWGFKRGMSKGDIIFVVRPKNLEVGDVVIFNGNQKNPIIHRIISLNPLTTKGDHNSDLLQTERNIKQEQLIGKAVFRIPVVGWVKLIFFEFSRNPNERGLCV